MREPCELSVRGASRPLSVVYVGPAGTIAGCATTS